MQFPVYFHAKPNAVEHTHLRATIINITAVIGEHPNTQKKKKQ